jgi:hypothetical protein
MNVEADSRYMAELILIYIAASAGDLKLRLSAPSGATAKALHFAGLDVGASALGTSVYVEYNGNPLGVDSVFGGLGGNTDLGARVQMMLVTSSTPGIFRMQWGQNASNSVHTLVAAGSSLELIKIP